MSDRAAYFALVSSRPDMFRNPPGASFEILLDEADIHQAEQAVAQKLADSSAPTEWAEVGIAFRDQYVTLLRDAVRFADGSLGTYIRMVEPEASFPGVVVLPVWKGQILLIRHFRHATRAWHLEIPRGFGLSADPAESARTELTEEIGASAATLTQLGEVYPDAGADNSKIGIFYAEVESYGQPDAQEGI